MLKLNLQFFGGRGASGGAGLEDGPTPGGGGGSNARYGQPNTPQMMPKPNSIEGIMGAKGRPRSVKDALENINPDIRKVDALSYEDYQANCQRCAVTFELARRGYNVEAEATRSNDIYPSGGNYLKAFKNATYTNVGATTTNAVNKNVLNNMSKWGEGSRAIVEVSNAKGGHAFNVEYHRGKLYYYDAQTNSKYDPARVFNHVNRKAVRIVRTDNLALGNASDLANLVRKKRS